MGYLPTLSLPKGGGAIRGIGEKFGANPVTGTGSMSVPIAISPGRSGFAPQLSLSYDSGSGNGPFGFGWSLSLPSITRKTDKGLPRYLDKRDQEPDSDVFVLSGAEDLVPEYEKDADGNWLLEQGKHVFHDKPRTVNGATYHVRRYRPRVEGLFARIERWTNQADRRDTFWRSISKDNVATWYGRPRERNGRIEESRIADPADPSRVFSWLISESHDGKGNVIVYEYKRENSEGILEDAQGKLVTKVHERNRTEANRSANLYLERIRYGNHTPYLPKLDAGSSWPAPPGEGQWLFEVVFDYGEYDAGAPTPTDKGTWAARNDPFSSYRSGFEVRTYRLCQRVLMFHHFPQESGVGANCLVRSTDFTYSYEQDPENAQNPVFSFLNSLTQSGYKRNNGRYTSRAMPPLEFEYSQPTIQQKVCDIDAESLENLPHGLDGSIYQWVDLDGEGLPGILTEQAGEWFYKRNLSPVNRVPDNGGDRIAPRFGPAELVAAKPATALAGGKAQFLDLAGDGQVDLVDFEDPAPGFYERTQDSNWEPFRPFISCPRLDTRDPNLKFIDLDGDGHADILISEHEVYSWHASLGESGFGPVAGIVRKSDDEEKAPRLVFADGTQSIHLADMSGDGMTDLVRIRNGEVCYWPNLGYARFGAKVTMDHAPWFDTPDQFDQKRIRLADIDGSGVTDIIYLHTNGVHLYFNQSGNTWSQPRKLTGFPPMDNLAAVQVADLLCNGTACLVWSSPLPGDTGRPMRYINLIGDRKPHLLVKIANNLGAETTIAYAPSTKFHVQDKLDGKPWITRLPFPVHVVERIETHDHISRNRFVTRYAYHHGYFDGQEREFRGFAMVEQWDTEQIGAFTRNGQPSAATNEDPAIHVPPVHTKTWFHIGAYLDGKRISRQFEDEYFREPGLTDQQARTLLLPDTILPAALTSEEEQEACRALKGMMLRQEVYADDAFPGASEPIIQRVPTPYTAVEQDFTVRALQPRGKNRHGIFFSHPREMIIYHYERNPTDPRVQHALTLEVDDFGNVLKEVAVGYGRREKIYVVDKGGVATRQPNGDLNRLESDDRNKQTHALISYTDNQLTNAIDDKLKKPDGNVKYPDDYRTPLTCETRTYELTGMDLQNNVDRFSFQYWTKTDLNLLDEIDYAAAPDLSKKQKRLIEHRRTLYRPDDLGAAQNDDPLTLLPLGTVQPVALPGEVYKLAFTPALIAQVFQRDSDPLLPDPGNVLGGQGPDRGGYVVSQQLKADARFPTTDPDGHWWIPSGRTFYDRDPKARATDELKEAHDHFFLTRRFQDPFNSSVFLDYAYDLLLSATEDALGNTVDAKNDFRVLQPRLLKDPNGNKTAVAFDALGMVAGTAVMGKEFESDGNPKGDLLDGFDPDLTRSQLDAFMATPREAASQHTESLASQIAYDLLANATTRIVYDFDCFRNSHKHNLTDKDKWEPVFAATIVREKHVSDLAQNEKSKLQIDFSYSDGFGREIQKKIQAEPGPAPQRDSDGNIIVGPDGQPLMTLHSVSPRWVGSGWMVFNNKGKPVRKYEPFFTDTHRFEFDVRIGVSQILFYDPVERVVATLHPNHTYEKVLFDPWRQETWDVNDTVAIDPCTDHDVKRFLIEPDGTSRIPRKDYSPTWYALRTDPALATEASERWPDPKMFTAEKHAAEKASIHAATPTVAYADTLGRTFLTVAHNKYKFSNTPAPVEEDCCTRVILDIKGNQREVRDAIVQNGDTQGRIVMRYDYDMLGNRVHQASMEAGERWVLNDVAGKPIRAWDSRGHNFRTVYDELRRPLEFYTAEIGGPELKVGCTVYGEMQPNPEEHNLRGRVFQICDQAGTVISDDYDFKGNLLSSRRQLAVEYKTVLNWAAAVPLETEQYAGQTSFDALNRPIQLIAPHSNQPDTKINVIQPRYNEAALLEQLHAWLQYAWLQQDTEPAVLLNPATASMAAITNIDYDAKGRRTLIDYGNGARTTYDYDPHTFQLTRLCTMRGQKDPPECEPRLDPRPCKDPPEICDRPASFKCVLQDLQYAYDPSGNITFIRDNAQQSIYFRNSCVEPSNDYTYDALYRLIEATGREHLGQSTLPTPPDAWNTFHTRVDHPGDGTAMGTYIERYVYDAVGNIMTVQHRGNGPEGAGWKRNYTYDEPSQIEPPKKSNRLSSTSVGINNPVPERYVHDIHGNMIRMPHLGGTYPEQNMHWDYKDQLHQTDLGGGGTAYYVYDATGQRVRKIWEKNANLTEERIYLGGFEIYRKKNGQGDVTLERETLHIMDDKQRVALVETRTKGTDHAPKQLIRYQFGNHLGSANLELDDLARIISYEEYFPYGITSYQAVRSQTEIPKRYRYTGKERDEESGLYYHGARYYAPWLGRWTSCDPKGVVDGLNIYTYCRNNPIILADPAGTQATPRPASGVQPPSPPPPPVASPESIYYEDPDKPLRLSLCPPDQPERKVGDSRKPSTASARASTKAGEGSRHVASPVEPRSASSKPSSRGTGAGRPPTTKRENSLGGLFERVATGLRSASEEIRDWLPGVLAVPLAGEADYLSGWSRFMGGIFLSNSKIAVEGLVEAGAGHLSMFGLKEATTERWGAIAGTSKDFKIPHTLASDINRAQEVQQLIAPNAALNGMHAWHAATNAAVSNRLGPIGAPLLGWAGIIHESPLDVGSFLDEQHNQGTVNHTLDSLMDIHSNTFGILLGLVLTRKTAVVTAAFLGNYIPGPWDYAPVGGCSEGYKGNPADAWGQYP